MTIWCDCKNCPSQWAISREEFENCAEYVECPNCHSQEFSTQEVDEDTERKEEDELQ